MGLPARLVALRSLLGELASDRRGALTTEYVVLVGTLGLLIIGALVGAGPFLLASYERSRAVLIGPFPLATLARGRTQTSSTSPTRNPKKKGRPP